MAARKHLIDNMKKTVKGVSALNALFFVKCRNIITLLLTRNNLNNNSERNSGLLGFTHGSITYKDHEHRNTKLIAKGAYRTL